MASCPPELNLKLVADPQWFLVPTNSKKPYTLHTWKHQRSLTCLHRFKSTSVTRRPSLTLDKPCARKTILIIIKRCNLSEKSSLSPWYCWPLDNLGPNHPMGIVQWARLRLIFKQGKKTGCLHSEKTINIYIYITTCVCLSFCVFYWRLIIKKYKSI